MPEQKNNCLCEGGVRLIFSCSGAADVGEISDRAGRSLASQDFGKMYCLAGIGGNVSGIIATTNEANQILVIDGCHLDCAKKTLEERGIEKVTHFRITDLGIEKSKSPATEERISEIVDHAKKLF